MLGSLTFRERLICEGQISNYLSDLGDPYLEKLKASFGKHGEIFLNQRGVNVNQPWIKVYLALAQNVN